MATTSVLTVAARGKAARSVAPRASHAEFHAAADRSDPVDVLEHQSRTRVPELVPIRYGRMLVSPFTFYRGAAAIMAEDLASTPQSGLRVQCCGDAHLSNFGVFGSPDRRLVFDLNDFDETLPGPWEWDVKRLAASMLIAAQSNGFRKRDQQRAVLDCVASYRTTMASFAGMGNLDVWYSRFEIESVLAKYADQFTPRSVKGAQKALAKARTKDSMSALSKLTHVVDGELRIVDESPLVVPIDRLADGVERDRILKDLRGVLAVYRDSLPTERRRLFDQFELADLARKVVGVGSVGNEAWIALLLGPVAGEPLFLQIKEAAVGARGRRRRERVRKPRRARRRRAAADAGQQRRLPGLAACRCGDRQAARLLRPTAQGLEGLGRDRAAGPREPGGLRPDVRLDARAGPRPYR
jgi:uncharacterized protein (DUF2252 family)